ncbi:MAG: NAD(P) transhydrogenase subunit alpha [Alphaproteobacteria bacterium]|nr:NAD(P) transhydrogenase subunit alpha [Alphaproteobacteria bacterium]
MYSFEILFTVLVLAMFVGYFAILGVTPALYSPLMSFSNAISGIIIIGAIASDGNRFWEMAAIFLAAVNIFGGFAVSARMLKMFAKKEHQK